MLLISDKQDEKVEKKKYWKDRDEQPLLRLRERVINMCYYSAQYFGEQIIHKYNSFVAFHPWKLRRLRKKGETFVPYLEEMSSGKDEENGMSP